MSDCVSQSHRLFVCLFISVSPVCPLSLSASPPFLPAYLSQSHRLFVCLFISVSPVCPSLCLSASPPFLPAYLSQSHRLFVCLFISVSPVCPSLCLSASPPFLPAYLSQSHRLFVCLFISVSPVCPSLSLSASPPFLPAFLSVFRPYVSACLRFPFTPLSFSNSVSMIVTVFLSCVLFLSVRPSAPPYRLVGRMVKASASRAEDPGFETRLRRDFFRVESYQ